MPFAGFDDDWVIRDAALFDFFGGSTLFDFAFFVELFEFFGERSGIDGALGAEKFKGEFGGIEAAGGIEAGADLKTDGFGVDGFDAGAAHEFLEAGATCPLEDFDAAIAEAAVVAGDEHAVADGAEEDKVEEPFFLATFY